MHLKDTESLIKGLVLVGFFQDKTFLPLPYTVTLEGVERKY